MNSHAIRILVVDDDPDILGGTARVLQQAGHAAATAATAEEAVQVLPAFQPDLILLDRDLPGMDGLELCRQIKQMPACADVFVILISGTYTDSDEQAEGLEAGADGYIVRPIANRELAARIAVFVRLLKMTRSLREERQRLEASNAALRQAQRSALNVMEDAVAARDRAVAAGASLQESEERFRATFEQAAVGIADVGLDGCWLRVNQRLCNITGYSREELLQRTFQEVTHPDDLDAVLERVRQVLAGDIPMYEMEKRYIRKDGAFVWVNLTVSVLREPSGTPKHFISVIEDITDRKNAEAERANLQDQLTQAQKMESVGRLAGGVAHDFNNLLTAIIGYAQFSLDLLPPEHPVRAYIDEILRGANRSAAITRQLLAFARKQMIAPKVLDLNEAVADMLGMLQRLIGEDIHLAWRPGLNVGQVKMDPSQIDQILANLCVNARDAITGVGKVTVETNHVTFDDAYCAQHAGFVPGEYVMLAVSDDGCGMDRETLEHIFEPFFTTKGVGEGTGLGLATVYGVVRQNNGFINVYSEPGKGTTFRIYLPRVAETIVTMPSKAEPKTLSRGTETILVVEDETAVRKMVRLFLERHGYTVLDAERPHEALRLAAEHAGTIELLITDVIMPEMNGRDLAQLLVRQRPHLKCMFMSGYTADVIAHRGILDDNVNFIAKPFACPDLIAKVGQVLEDLDS
jgi:PAS domain S-box-containing protein